MSNKLKDIIDEIQFKLNLTQEQIANRVGYSRPYLTIAIKNGTEGKIYEKLKREFENVLQNSTKIIPVKDKAIAYDALFSVLVAELAALKAEKTGEPIQSIIRKIYKAAEDEVVKD